ncbi:gamma-glutamyltransferase [Agaribacter flavus]|uniref:Glutathione hydrolase proenzyme n=1 Tax=Agaribacter flavus TaxID=1902781 RepID=A0ABV7FLX6_9ALTE
MKRILSVFILALSPCLFAQQVVLEDREPEAATGFDNKTSVSTKEFMVVAANPYASWAGKNIIERGGSAIDAAIAVQAMLSLVEPQSSGIGGGAFIMYWDNTQKRLFTYDGREVAGEKATSDMFMVDGKPMSWRDAVVGGKSVGVPGVMKALEMAHNAHGTLEWKDLFDDTIKQADDGFEVSPRLARLLSLDYHPGLNEFPLSSTYFKPGGESLKAGFIRKNPALAESLRQIAKEGADYLYTGKLAKQIVDTVNTAKINPGSLTLSDFSNYEAIKRSPLCGKYMTYKVCGMAPPSSGGVSVLQILKGLENKGLDKYGAQSAEFAHLFAQSSALAFADREEYIADLDFLGISPVPLVNSRYLNERAKQVQLSNKWEEAEAGLPYQNVAYAQDDAYELNSTSHISIIDKAGNAISMTTSVEFMFGSGLMVGGFMLNNQLTDFALSPSRDGKQVLNAVAAKKRPRSSMSPTIVFDQDNKVHLVVGSPGGSRIINYVAQTIVNVLAFEMDVQEAISAPRISNRNGYTALEKGTSLAAIKPALEAKGHEVRLVDLNSGIHAIHVDNGTLKGGADPRREGVAVGQ